MNFLRFTLIFIGFCLICLAIFGVCNDNDIKQLYVVTCIAPTYQQNIVFMLKVSFYLMIFTIGFTMSTFEMLHKDKV